LLKPIGRSEGIRPAGKRRPDHRQECSGVSSQAYDLKAVADSETGPDFSLPPERAAAAIETAGRFVNSLGRIFANLNAAYLNSLGC
jgi:hypothetical protein